MRFRVVGNDLPCNEVGFGWLGRTSARPPSALERAEARPPYSPASSRRERKAAPVDDDALTDEQALKACRVEQERRPADLIGASLPG